MKQLARRHFLSLGAAASASALLLPRFAFAGASHTQARFVFIIMRGALDGLAAVPPYGDPAYANIRGELAIAPPGQSDGALKLNTLFGLHPRLAFLGESFAARELVVFHAVASPYRERSHFDGQDVLESGFTRPHAVQTGWLNRALAALPAQGAVRSKEAGVALGQNVPLVMRGPSPVASWSPARMPALDADTLERITDLYASDPLLSQRLADGLATDSVAMEAQQEAAKDAGAPPPDGMLARAKPGNTGQGPGRYLETVRAAAGFLKRDGGPQVAVFDTSGWDTHANEGGAQGQLASRLAVLDGALRTLKDSLGELWPHTAVVLATEFGRTAAVNGTRGSDHGTGTAAFLLGGAVQGGRVVADWPGLSVASLYQRRDLAPTLDVRSVLKSVLRDHIGVPRRALDDSVFPDSASAKYLEGLVRA
jgi:uncharacterized protein (DUF1501 family)